ncbi:hypothetical protein J2W42_002238 [Rhizobium tibeticum]|uniref:hypothetical protein n=1 Tax=Rhizobium tibeticum TaxID=501024 RepID=UPI0027898724|nr:hypothetical protein [Rhizobium tibeticum]MDP9809390.1 hypothetical protein [Rhizobium tibeticum]
MWNHDISTAPRDRDLWLATKCGKVIKSHWIEKFGPGRWVGLGTKEQPIAWQLFVTPEYPNHQSEAGAFAAVNGKAGLANATSVEPSASELIVHKHEFLDDVGSGA